MAKRWYNYFLSVDQPEEGEDEASSEESGAPQTAAQTVAEIASGITAEPKFTGAVTSFLQDLDVNWVPAQEECHFPERRKLPANYLDHTP